MDGELKHVKMGSKGRRIYAEHKAPPYFYLEADSEERAVEAARRVFRFFERRIDG